MSIRVATVGTMILAALAVGAGGQEQPAAVLTLEEAIAAAVANNPGLAIARERVQRARGQVREAAAEGRFKIGTEAAHTRITPIATFTIPGPGGEEIEVRTRPESETTAQAALTQPIDISRRLSLARQLAGIQLDIQEFGEAQTLRQLIADVKNGYYTVLRASGNVDVARAAVEVAEERLRVARVQFEAGVAPRFDVTSAEVDVANLRQSLVQAENAVLVAKGALNNVLGVDVNRPFKVEEREAAVQPVTLDIEDLTRRAEEARPEVRQARLGVELAERAVRFTAKEDDPALALFAAANWTSETTAFNPNATTYTFGARASWPIWTGGVTKARVSQARDDLDIARRTLDQARLGVGLDVRTAALNVMESSRRVGTAQANVEQAREALRLSRVRYEAGVTTQLEVTDAEAALTQALTNLVGARYDYLSARAQLDRATASQPEYERLTSSEQLMHKEEANE